MRVDLVGRSAVAGAEGVAVVYLLSLVPMAFTIWMAVEAVRRGHAWPWLLIVLFFGPLGAAVYFFAVYLGEAFPRRVAARWAPRVDLDHLGAQARRLDKSELWVDYARGLREKKRFAQAAEAARQAVERDPKNLQGRYELGRNLAACGRFEEAIAPLEAVVEEEPGLDSGEALYALAHAQRQSGQLAAALASTTRLAESSSRPRYLYGHAMLQLESGDQEGARGTLRTIVDDAVYLPPYAKRAARPWVSKAKKALAKLGEG